MDGMLTEAIQVIDSLAFSSCEVAVIIIDDVVMYDEVIRL